MKMKVYIVTAYRYGNRCYHSYNIGVFSKKAQAIKCADSHAQYRGGKYECVIDECEIDKFNNDSDGYTKEIYRTKSIKE